MDIFSHALLPYLVGSLVKLNKRDLTALVVGGIIPDLDFLILWINYLYPSDLLLTHRGITHTLIFGLLLSLIMLYILSRGKVKSAINRLADFDISLTGRALIFVYVGVLSHLLLDYLTTWGVPLFYPLDASRVSADIFSPIEIVLAITSLAIIAVLLRNGLRNSQSRSTKVRLLAVFLIVIIAVGLIRIDGKEMSESFLGDANAKSYPDTDLFKWSVLEDNGSWFDVYEYDLLSGDMQHMAAFPYLEISSDRNNSNEDIGAALAAANRLPQVVLFRWRAYAVAINASFKDDIWHLEYYDPVARARQMKSPPMLKMATGGYSSIRVKVDDGKAFVV